MFDYGPADELKIRERIRELQETNTMLKFGYELAVYDLYELILHLLLEEDVLDDLKDLEQEEGTEYVFASISNIAEIVPEETIEEGMEQV